MKMKLIATALACLAAGSAQATFQQSSQSSPAPELYFTAWYLGNPDSSADDKSYSRDLGAALTTPAGSFVGTINDWASASNPTTTSGHLGLVADKTTAGYTASFAADATLNSWLDDFTTEQIATIRWNVTSADSNGAMRALTTASTVPTGTARQNYSQMRAWDGKWDTHLAAVSAMPGQGSLISEDGSSTATGADGVAFSGSNTNFGNNFGGTSNFDNSGLIGQDLNFYAFWEHTATGNTTTKVNFEQFLCTTGDCDATDLAGQWNFAANGTLTYAVAAAPVAAVPEADTYALMLAGLGLVGFLARRRKPV